MWEILKLFRKILVKSRLNFDALPLELDLLLYFKATSLLLFHTMAAKKKTTAQPPTSAATTTRAAGANKATNASKRKAPGTGNPNNSDTQGLDMSPTNIALYRAALVQHEAQQKAALAAQNEGKLFLALMDVNDS